VSYTLAFALQLKKKHGKTSVRVEQGKTSVRVSSCADNKPALHTAIMSIMIPQLTKSSCVFIKGKLLSTVTKNLSLKKSVAAIFEEQCIHKFYVRVTEHRNKFLYNKTK
jgi:hypothetical protein